MNSVIQYNPPSGFLFLDSKQSLHMHASAHYHQGGLTIACTIFQACHGQDLMGEWPEAHVNKDS